MRIIRLRDVMQLTGLARSTIYKYVEAGTFPQPIPPRRAFCGLDRTRGRRLGAGSHRGTGRRQRQSYHTLHSTG